MTHASFVEGQIDLIPKSTVTTRRIKSKIQQENGIKTTLKRRPDHQTIAPRSNPRIRWDLNEEEKGGKGDFTWFSHHNCTRRKPPKVRPISDCCSRIATTLVLAPGDAKSNSSRAPIPVSTYKLETNQGLRRKKLLQQDPYSSP